MRKFSTALLLLSATAWVPIAHAQTAYLPKMPVLQPPQQVASLILENNTAKAARSHYLTTGIVFAAGAVPSGAVMQAQFGTGAPVRAQIDERTHWPDGSVRMAGLSFLPPAVAAGANAPVTLEKGTGSAAPPLSMAAFTSGSATVDVTLGGHDYHLDVAGLLAGGTVSYWRRGPVVTEARVDAPITGAFHVMIDARIYADGSSFLDVTYANDLAFNHGGPESYTAVVKLGTRTTATTTINNQQPFTDWHQHIWSAGRSILNVVHDIPLLEATGMIPNYPLKGGFPANSSNYDIQTIANFTAPSNEAACVPLGPCAIKQQMGAVGGRPDIGILPLYTVAWLESQDQSIGRYVELMADAAGSVPWHSENAAGAVPGTGSATPIEVLAPAPGQAVATGQHPFFWGTDGCTGSTAASECSPMSYNAAANGTGFQTDNAHQPELAYVPYLLTDTRHYLDELNAQAGWNENGTWSAGTRNFYAPGHSTTPAGSTPNPGGQWDPPMNGAGGYVCGVNEQLRACAWSMRELALAALANPDGSQLKSYFMQEIQANYTWVTQDVGLNNKGQMNGWLDCYYDNTVNWLAEWQLDYWALAMEWQVRMGLPGAQAALNAVAPFLVNRFNQPANVFSPYNAVVYNGPFGTASGPFTTWAQVTAALASTSGSGPDNTSPGAGGGAPNWDTWQGDYGTAATSVVNALPSSIPGQPQAAAWIAAHPSPLFPSIPANPTWTTTAQPNSGP